MSQRKSNKILASSPIAGGKTGKGPAPARTRRNIARHSTLIVVLTTGLLVVLFFGRWLFAITNDYYASFVECRLSSGQALNGMLGLNPTKSEQESLAPIQLEWDLFTASHLCDEVYIESHDGTLLHGSLYNQGSDITVIWLPRFGCVAGNDFLPGAWLGGAEGYNLLLLDQRAHGESGGNVFGYGFLEQHDLAAWINWASETLSTQQFILWGEGTGANTALFASVNRLLDDRISLIVSESCYGSLHQLAARNIFHWYTVPAIPFLNAIEYKLDHSGIGYRVADTALLDALPDADQAVPALFLTSNEDDYILPEWSNAVFDAYPGEKAEVAGGGTHGTVYAIKKEEIEQLIHEHLNVK